MQVDFLGSFERTGIMKVHAIANAGLPSTIYMQLDSSSEPALPITPLCKVNWQSNEDFAKALPEAETEFSGTFIVNKYRLYSNELLDKTAINVHYGLIRTGGVQFNLTEVVAASNDDFLYQYDFYAIDAPSMFQVFKSQLAKYNLVQQVAFDIASYANGRRQSLEVIRFASLYPKLMVNAELQHNDLLIACKDTAGVGAVKHVSMSLGIAEESISASCRVTMTGLDKLGQKTQEYDVIIANPNYDDTPLHCILPPVSESVVAVKIAIDYLLELRTIGETLHMTSSYVLTDCQVANLHPLSADEIAGGVMQAFAVMNTLNEPIEGVHIYLTDTQKTLYEGWTQTNGMLQIKALPGSYVCNIAYEGIEKSMPITVASASTITVILDVVLLTMQIEIIGTDDYRLPNITLDANNVQKTTDENGVITIRGISGKTFAIRHQLGEVLHEELVKMQPGQTAKMRLYNSFDEEILFNSEFT